MLPDYEREINTQAEYLLGDFKENYIRKKSGITRGKVNDSIVSLVASYMFEGEEFLANALLSRYEQTQGPTVDFDGWLLFCGKMFANSWNEHANFLRSGLEDSSNPESATDLLEILKTDIQKNTKSKHSRNHIEY